MPENEPFETMPMDARLRAPHQQQIEKAFQTLDAPDHDDYRGQSTREYRRELARKMYRDGQDITRDDQAVETDRDIAGRLYTAGFSRDHIYQALHQASPYLADKDSTFKQHYCLVCIRPALSQRPVWQLRQTFWNRRAPGTMPERRLDKLGLATEIAPEIPAT